MLHRLCPQDFLPPASDPQNVWVLRHEKTLVLARTLHVCAEASRAKTDILCRAIREPQQCITPLMTLNGDNVKEAKEASLLRPAEQKLGSSPIPEEETTLLGEGDGLSWVLGPAPGHVEIPRFVEPAEQTIISIASTVPCSCPSCEEKKLWEGIDVDPNNPRHWVWAYLERDNRLPVWWEEFCPLVHSADRHCDDAQVKSMAHWQAAAFHCQLPRGKYMAPRSPHLAWQHWEGKNILAM